MQRPNQKAAAVQLDDCVIGTTRIQNGKLDPELRRF
jgi:hypothetical protein